MIKQNGGNHESFIIFLDYFGETLDNLIELSKTFTKLFIIDHHKTFENLIPSLKEKNL